MNAPIRRSTLALMVGLILLGVGLRLLHLYDAPLRGDEVFTIRYWMRQPLALTLANNVIEDPHPPGIIGLYRGWALLLGDDEKVARFLPALANSIGVAAMYALGKRLANRRAGLLAALFWALHPFQIWHAQDARSYGVWGATNILTVWLAVRALGSSRRRDWLLYAGAATVGAYLYYLELFTLAALSLWALLTYRHDRAVLQRWFAVHLLIGLLLAPWFLQPRLLAGGGYGGTTGGFNPDLLLTWFLPTLSFGETLAIPLSPAVVAGLWPALGCLLLAGALLWWRQDRRAALLVVLLVVVPAALLALVSLRLNVFTPRYILSAVPALLLLVSVTVVTLWRAGVWKRWTAIAVGVVWVGLSAASLAAYFTDYAKTPPWPQVVAFLENHARPDDLIVQAAADEAFNYYLDEMAEPFDRKQLPANPNQPGEEITTLLDADLQTHERMWRVGQTFTDWPSYGITEAWFADNMQPVLDTTVAGLRVQQWRRWQVDEDSLSGEPLATFGDVAHLRSYELIRDAGDARRWLVVLYWEALRQTGAPLVGSVQLIGPTNPATGTPLWSQDDHPPQMGRADTTNWQPGVIFRDVFTLGLDDVPDGEYVLVARLYDRETGERLPVDDGDGAVIAAVTIGE